MENNLDSLCAEYGFKIADRVAGAFDNDSDKAHNAITKALGVLQEQGLYAMTLFCNTGNLKVGSLELLKLAEEMLSEKPLNLIKGSLQEEMRSGGGLGYNLDNLVFAVNILEKTLTYSRYHVKAMKKNDGGET